MKLSGKKTPAKGTPVFLTDRRQPALMAAINALEKELLPPSGQGPRPRGVKLGRPRRARLGKQAQDQVVYRKILPKNAVAPIPGIWLSKAGLDRLTRKTSAGLWYWLPPVIWPENESQWQEHISQLLRMGARRFVLNAPWQMSMFRRPEGLNLWAGPFCNFANPLAIRGFKMMGGQGVIVSPEMGRSDLEALAAKSVLPVGVVVFGFWPFCMSRGVADSVKLDQPFVSPKGEQGWVRQFGHLYWVYPNWPVDLRAAQDKLQKAGFRMFVHLDEPVPKTVKIKRRPGLWNYEIGLK